MFQPNAFQHGWSGQPGALPDGITGCGGQVNGWSLEGEYYFRKVDQLEVDGFIPVTKLDDHGFQLQASAMLVPRVWQIYLSGSKIFGEYGDPWDVALGVNWFPYETASSGSMVNYCTWSARR